MAGASMSLFAIVDIVITSISLFVIAGSIIGIAWLSL